VGPTALDQSSRIDRFVDKKVADELDCIVKRVIPNLDTDRAFSGEYVGIRPGTDQRDYQIHLSPEKKWIAVAGIRSTGLTASLGIGNYVVRQLACIVGQSTPLSEVKTTPLPPVSDLIRDFRSTKDGSVALHGHRYAVTHPLTKLGWNSFQSTTGNSRL
jgi:glycerol-3-phosphate dehydrogenase